MVFVFILTIHLLNYVSFCTQFQLTVGTNFYRKNHAFFFSFTLNCTIFYSRKMFKIIGKKLFWLQNLTFFLNSLNDCVFRKISATFSKIILSFSLLVFSPVECHHAYYLNSVYIPILVIWFNVSIFYFIERFSDAAWYYSQFYLWSFVFAHCIYGMRCREEIAAVSHKNSLVDW